MLAHQFQPAMTGVKRSRARFHWASERSQYPTSRDLPEQTRPRLPVWE